MMIMAFYESIIEYCSWFTKYKRTTVSLSTSNDLTLDPFLQNFTLMVRSMDDSPSIRVVWRIQIHEIFAITEYFHSIRRIRIRTPLRRKSIVRVVAHRTPLDIRNEWMVTAVKEWLMCGATITFNRSSASLWTARRRWLRQEMKGIFNLSHRKRDCTISN